MQPLTCTRTGQPIALMQQIASSGEGEIWRTSQPGSLAKIYYSPRPERIQKLEAMIAHPPQDPNAHINHISFAWPTSLLQDQAGAQVGFLMPEVTQAVDLLEVYSPLRRQMALPEFNWLYLHATAMNIASLVWAIHSAGYVLGDLKPQNILVTEGALPSIIDTDSFQMRHPTTGQLYRCPVGSEGFTPAELMDQDLATLEQTEVHDRFRLGVIFYLLLFGDHPFKGRWTGAGDSPDPNELIRQGWWPHAPRSPIQSSVLTVPLTIVHPALQACFTRCFNDGHLNPSARPTAREWMQGLKVAIADLKRCRKVKTHTFSVSAGPCCWCTRSQKLGVDIFPAVPTMPKNPILRELQHLGPQVERAKQYVQSQLSEEFVSTQTNSLRTLDNWQTAIETRWLTAVHSGALNPKRLRPLGSIVALNPVTESKPQTIWVFVLSIMALFLMTLITLSQSKLEGEHWALTLVGAGLCAALVGLCFVLQKASATFRS
jgi:DNA-binding helix-hairpin-helix protein with protein kinase domain